MHGMVMHTCVVVVVVVALGGVVYIYIYIPLASFLLKDSIPRLFAGLSWSAVTASTNSDIQKIIAASGTDAAAPF